MITEWFGLEGIFVPLVWVGKYQTPIHCFHLEMKAVWWTAEMSCCSSYMVPDCFSVCPWWQSWCIGLILLPQCRVCRGVQQIRHEITPLISCGISGCCLPSFICFSVSDSSNRTILIKAALYAPRIAACGSVTIAGSCHCLQVHVAWGRPSHKNLFCILDLPVICFLLLGLRKSMCFLLQVMWC